MPNRCSNKRSGSPKTSSVTNIPTRRPASIAWPTSTRRQATMPRPNRRNTLAGHYVRTRDYGKAEPLLQTALRIRQKNLGKTNGNTATSLNNLAELYMATGDYAKAEPLLQQALQITQMALGNGHPDTATSLNNLAELYPATGDYANAEPLLEQAL